jgi:general secretion pathway protein G
MLNNYFSIPMLRFNKVRGARGFIQQGFTLIELLVVMLILGVLAALIVPKVLGRGDDARITAAKVDISNVKNALKMYYLDNQRYPTMAQGLEALVTKPTIQPIPTAWKTGGYLDKLPKDPWGNAYIYLRPGVRSDIEVFSYGADGKPGGDVGTVDADIME